MYSLFHTAVGYTIIETSLFLAPNDVVGYAVGIPLAFLSHYAVDYLKERGMSKEDEINYDMKPSIFLFIVSIFLGNWLNYLLGLSFGNLMDWIDKKMYLAKFYPKKYKATYYFHKQKTGIQYTLTQTKNLQIVAFLCLLVFFVLIKFK